MLFTKRISSLLRLSYDSIRLVRLPTMPVPVLRKTSVIMHNAMMSDEHKRMSGPLDHYGPMLMRVMENHTPMQKALLSLRQCSARLRRFRSRWWSARAVVYISIGHLQTTLTLKRGASMRPGLLYCVINTGFVSTALALKIYLRYSAHPEHTTESMENVW